MRSYRNSAMRPSHRFRLYPELGSLYVVVNVWATRAEMLRYSDEGDAKVGPKTDATCAGIEVIDFKRGHHARKQPVFAEVNFYRGRLSIEVITHEFFHATMAWGRRVRFKWHRLGDDDSVNADEERITYVHGRLCRAFVNRANAAKLYEVNQ